MGLIIPRCLQGFYLNVNAAWQAFVFVGLYYLLRNTLLYCNRFGCFYCTSESSCGCM